MVQEDKLSSVLGEFARTLITDFPIQGILDHLVERIVEVLPITAAGVTLISAGKAPRFVAASNESALRFEQLQTKIWQGPCLEAYDTGKAVSIPDLGVDDRFPEFASEALKAGLAAVFTFPLSPGTGRLGALDLYRDTPGTLDSQDMSAAQTLADVAAAYLQNAQSRDEARATSDMFHHSALHDPLTELPNRVLLNQRIEHAAQRAQRSNNNAAILFADLDRFKHINDTRGHDVGDELLLAVAQRLSGLVRPGDTLARISGDEFVFLCEDLRSADDAYALAERIGDAFSTPFEVSDATLRITASIGLAYASSSKDISGQLITDADTAMYQAKRKGGDSHQVIDLREAFENDERNNLESRLRQALLQDELDIAYQPIVNVGDQRIVGIEALLRWTDVDRGAVSPMLMIAAAEQSSLINEITEWILTRSCSNHSQLLMKHPGIPLTLSVNVSPRELMTQGFCSLVASVITSTNIDPTALVLEVTESILVDDSDHAITVLTDLKHLGLRLALDNFGIGFFSLSCLHRLPIEIVKIDQSFIANMEPGVTSRDTLVQAIANLAHTLGYAVSAEGVENQNQHDQISRFNCDTAQGYFYAHPMPFAEISDLLESSLSTSQLYAPNADAVTPD